MTQEIEVVNGMIPRKEVEETVGNLGDTSTLIADLNRMRQEGQVGTPEFTAKMRQMEVVLGVSQISPFGTNELEIFEENMREMSYADLQKVANKIGINPYLEKPLLKKSLIREFTHYTRNSRRNIMPQSSQTFVLDPNNPEHDKLKKILADI
jgi:hypothetical protein